MKSLLIFLLLFNHCAIAKEFDTTPQAIKTIDIPKGYKSVSYNKKYKLAIPEDFKLKQHDFGIQFLVITSPDGKAAIILNEIPATNKMLLNSEEYGLKAYSRRQLLTAIFDTKYVSNNEVNETRKIIFGNSSNVEVYTRDGFMFFRENRMDHPKTEASVRVSSPINDDVFTMDFLVGDEDLIMNVIKSLKVVN